MTDVATTLPNVTTEDLLKPCPRMPTLAPTLPLVVTMFTNGGAPMFSLYNTPQLPSPQAGSPLPVPPDAVVP
jgi:hypothetical protein